MCDLSAPDPAGYYLDLAALQSQFRVATAPTLSRRFGRGAAQWPPSADVAVHYLQISPDEAPCAEVRGV